MTKTGFPLSKRVVLSFAMCLLSGTASAQTCYSDLIAFGDSLTDTGNIYDFSGGLFGPSPPYVAGRFSNGPVWLEELAGSLGLSSLNSTQFGSNYAFGGAKTGPVDPTFPPSLLQQSVLYFSDSGLVADPNALYVIWGGLNEARNNDVADAASNIASMISDLAVAGATNFLVPNLYDIGLTPESQAGDAPGGNAAVITQATLAYNATLAAELTLLSATLPGASIIDFDVFTFVNQILANPGGFDLFNVTDPCWTGDFSGANGVECVDADSYLYWDAVHPTTAAHTLIGNEAFDRLVSASPIDTDGDCEPDSSDPDDDGDGIGDNLDDYPLTPSNLCSGNNAKLAHETIIDSQQCAAPVSVTIKGTTTVTVTGNLEVISSMISIESGFGVSGQLSVIAADPCPACPPL